MRDHPKGIMNELETDRTDKTYNNFTMTKFTDFCRLGDESSERPDTPTHFNALRIADGVKWWHKLGVNLV